MTMISLQATRHQFRAGRYKISHLQQYLNVDDNCIETLRMVTDIKKYDFKTGHPIEFEILNM